MRIMSQPKTFPQSVGAVPTLSRSTVSRAAALAHRWKIQVKISSWLCAAETVPPLALQRARCVLEYQLEWPGYTHIEIDWSPDPVSAERHLVLEPRVTSNARTRISIFSKSSYFCVCNSVSGDKAHFALSPETKLHIQKCNTCRDIEKRSYGIRFSH